VGGGAIILGHLELVDHVHITAATVVTRSIHKPGQYSGVFPFDDNAVLGEERGHAAPAARAARALRALEKKTHDTPSWTSTRSSRSCRTATRSCWSTACSSSRRARAHQGAEERHDQRAVLPGALSGRGR
jgi:hypothetical protein